MRRTVGWGGLLLLWAACAQAEIVLCGDATVLQGFQLSVDPSQAVVCPAPYTQHVISKANTAVQRALLTGTPQRHLEVVDGLAVLKPQAERDAIDQAIADAQAAQDAAAAILDAAANDTDCRNVSIAALTTKFDTLRSTIVAGVTDALAASAMNTPATIRTGVGNAMAEAIVPILNVMEKMAKCLRATAGR